MMLFWVVCGIMILIALAFVLPPLWQTPVEAQTSNDESGDQNISIYKDQLAELEADLRNGIISGPQYELDRDEIKGRLLDDVTTLKKSPGMTKVDRFDRRTAYVVAIALPVLAIALYAKFGNVNARSAQPETPPIQTTNSENAPAMSQAQIEANVARLAKRLESNPSDAQGWIMLARSYNTLGKYDEASKAYEKAAALKPKDAEVLANYAFALAMANGRKFEGRPIELLKQAVQLAPDNPDVLGLAGGAAFEQKNYKQAVEYWERFLKQAPADSDLRQAVTEKLREAKTLAGQPAEKGQ